MKKTNGHNVVATVNKKIHRLLFEIKRCLLLHWHDPCFAHAYQLAFMQIKYKIV